jgi:hypothetical protein
MLSQLVERKDDVRAKTVTYSAPKKTKLSSIGDNYNSSFVQNIAFIFMSDCQPDKQQQCRQAAAAVTEILCCHPPTVNSSRSRSGSGSSSIRSSSIRSIGMRVEVEVTGVPIPIHCQSRHQPYRRFFTPTLRSCSRWQRRRQPDQLLR